MQDSEHRTPKAQQVIAILWPSFLISSLATILLFFVFDPRDLLASQEHFELSRMGVYTIGFFLVWVLTAASSALTVYFERPTT